jgi:DNA-binding response OmpR family regulator
VTRVLVVDDEPQIRRALRTSLEAHGYEAESVGTGGEAVVGVADRAPDLVLLDLGLPDLDGTEVIARIRAFSQVPIIVLSVRESQRDKVAALDAGADDYVTKPFRLAELLARVRAHLRGPKADQRPEQINAGDLHIDVAARRAWLGTHELALRPREHDLLVLLASEPGRVATRERIMEEVWDEHWYGSTKTLDVHVSSLRRKLGAHPELTAPKIVALPRVGYRLDAP